MDNNLQEDGDRVEPEISVTESQDDPSEEGVIDEEDDVEELHNSLKQIVQDEAVKPRLQCVMMDPSFSMVTVQSEDSGIVWETASSRCSTPWASEASSTSDAYSLEGSGTQGKIVIIMDEDKIIRKRKKRSGRGKLGERLRRPSSRNFPGGNERPVMTEVSVPNVRPENTEENGESKLDKEQELFSLVSEGYEILNIVVPSRLPTVDEEDSTELADNLSYLEENPRIKSTTKYEQTHDEIEEDDQVIVQVEVINEEPSAPASTDKQTLKDGTSDMDYFEKFTLLDEHIPGESVDAEEKTETGGTEGDQTSPNHEKDANGLSASDDTFVFVTDVEIASEHLDEVFYGNGQDEHDINRQFENEEEDSTDEREPFKSAVKESGSSLFGSEDTILTPIFLPAGPPKIIDPILLEEPPAMSFHYSDLYEDAIGVRLKEEDMSDVESVVSEKSLQRRLSDSDDASGYLEKFILKDETPQIEDEPVTDDPPEEGTRLIWSQSKFELTGCLTRVEEEVDVKEEKEKETTAESFRRSPIPCEDEDCDAVLKTSEDKTEDLQRPDLQEEIARIERKSPDVCSEVLESPVPCDDEECEAVIKTSEDKTEDLQRPDLQEEIARIERKSPDVCSEVLESPVPCDDEECEAVIKTSEDKTEDLQRPDLQEEIARIERKSPDVCSEVLESPVPCDDEECEAVIKTSEDKTEDLQRPDLQEEIARIERKSPEVCNEVSESQVEDVEKTIEDDKTEAERTEPSVCLADQEIELKPEEASEEMDSVKEITTDSTEELVFAKSSEIICEEVVPSKEEDDQVKSEAAVDQEIEIMDQEIPTEITPVMPEEVCEEVASGRETTEDKIEESAVAQSPEGTTEEVVPDTDEINRTEEAALDQETPIMQKEIVPEVTVVKPEETCEEAVIDEEIVKEKVAESVDVERPEIVHEEIVTDSENIEMRADHESVDQEAEVAVVVVEPEDTFKDATEEPESIAHKIITASDISRGVTDVESKDVACLKCEPPDDTVPTSEKELEEESPVLAIGAREDLTEQELSETEQIIEMEPKTSADDQTSLIKEEKEPILLEDTGLQHSDEGRNYLEVEIEAERDHIDKGADRELLTIHERHRDAQSKPNLGLGEKRERMFRLSPLVMAESAEDGEEDEGLRPVLRSFSPQEDLSAFGEDPALSAPEPFQFLHHDEEEEVPTELDYEVITQQEARELPELETEEVKDTEAEEPPDEGRNSMPEVDRDQGLEADYEIIESLKGIPLSEAELAEADLKRQTLDTFCLVCQCPISSEDKLTGEHQDHEVITVEQAYEDIRNKLSERIAVLQERSENVTDLVSELELAYNSVEEHCKASEQGLDEQNEEIMRMVMDQYNDMSHNMEEGKKAKLEQLYDRIVSFQESIDSAKETLEKSTKEIEETNPLTLVSSSKDINTSLTTALDAALSLELTPSAFPLFEDYAKSPPGNGRKELKGIPVPQKPHLQPQEPSSATSTSVTVYWRVNEGDIIDCFQVYCMEEPQGAVSEEYRVTVKESYCTLEDLEADKCYKVWVMAVNYTGCSLPSDKLSFRTAPSVPAIDTERCTVCWDCATIRWSPTHPDAAECYTLEYCRQYACEGEGLRSISAIRTCEQKVLLHPNENYLFYIKAANAFGASEQSEAALISTRGTRFHFLPESAHPALELSADRTTVRYPEEAYSLQTSTNECVEIQGELLPPRGHHYWETAVDGSDAYRIGVAYASPARDCPLGEDSTSWCLHCVPTATSCRFELLHNSTQTAIFTVEVPVRVGVLLDFLRGRLSFFNAQNGQLLGSHWHRFSRGCHALLALEQPGVLGLGMVSEVPEFAKH